MTHTDAGELLKLAEEYEAGLRKMEAAGYEEFAEIIPKAKMVIAALRQAASQGSAGGELGWNATQRELEIRQLRIDNARLRDEAFLRTRDPAQAPKVPVKSGDILTYELTENGGLGRVISHTRECEICGQGPGKHDTGFEGFACDECKSQWTETVVADDTTPSVPSAEGNTP